MATIDKLNYLNETKSQIKNALNDLGAEITSDDTFRSYVTKINEISEEYPTEAQIQSIQLQNIQPQSLETTSLNIGMQPLEQPQEELIEEVQEEQVEETQEETTLNDEEVE